jgi:hypothetical protein
VRQCNRLTLHPRAHPGTGQRGPGEKDFESHGRRIPQVRATAGAGGSLCRQSGDRGSKTDHGGTGKPGGRGGTPTRVCRCPASLPHVWCAAGDGRVPQHSHRPMRALSGSLARLWETRPGPCRRGRVSRPAEAALCLSGHRQGVLPILGDSDWLDQTRCRWALHEEAKQWKRTSSSTKPSTAE